MKKKLLIIFFDRYLSKVVFLHETIDTNFCTNGIQFL